MIHTINPVIVMEDVKRDLAADVGSGDVSAALLPMDLVVDADIISREPMLVCGRPWVDEVFRQINPAIRLEWLVEEGAWLPEPTTLCRIHGLARDILTAERSALNFLQTLSATATQTWHCVQLLKATKTRLLDTRKTLPGLRMAQKYAVACAGGVNHRMGLYDAFLIKENHIAACGSIRDAVKRARDANHTVFLEVEVETLDELREALAAKPDRILLDNFTLDMMKEAVAMNQPQVCCLEASGGIDLSTIKAVAETGVDYISVGAITKSIQAIDLSLLLRERH
ncbi:carboxylating nicotinate-nucleotide diphosphorylase [Legionella sp. CNM-4043-24]|uniref:carboxylating nicotinate-nucleotide diphosphorylase n=1 Tax=Legionella sp. CNM-4043-24 TaxID=3421646 RepID=UPI00403AA22C